MTYPIARAQHPTYMQHVTCHTRCESRTVARIHLKAVALAGCATGRAGAAGAQAGGGPAQGQEPDSRCSPKNRA
jgi:hypothetical protein